jgi:hypothetical protein
VQVGVIAAVVVVVVVVVAPLMSISVVHSACGECYARKVAEPPPPPPHPFCSCCGALFLEEDWEEVFLERGACPFCRLACSFLTPLTSPAHL